MKTSLTLIASLMAIPWLGAAEKKKPNFILMLADDQHWDATSVMMHPSYTLSKRSEYQTPNLEKLAASGIRFSAAYAPAPVCAPTRISLQTGKSPAALRWCKAGPSVTSSSNPKLLPPTNRKDIKNEETTIAEVLKKAGYTSAHYGKWHLGGGGPEKHGYDASDGNTKNGSAAHLKDTNPVDIFGMSDRAIAFMKEAKKANKPFFIQLSWNALHHPGNASKANIAKFKKLLPNLNERSVQRIALTSDLDAGVGRIVKAVDSLGLGSNTYIIYMSDNGAGGKKKANGISGKKGSIGEGGIRSPLIIRGPGIKKNSWNHQRVVGYDLLPTFASMANIKSALPKDIEGGDISHLFLGSTKLVKRPFSSMVFHFPHYQATSPETAIYEKNYKLVYNYEKKSSKLYDIENDIEESKDLSKKLPDLTAKLKKKMIAQLKALKADIPTSNKEYDSSKPSTAIQKGRRKRNRK